MSYFVHGKIHPAPYVGFATETSYSVFVPRVDLSSVWIGLLCTTVVVYLILGVVYFGPHFVYSTNGLFFQLTGCVCMLKVLLNGILLGLGCGGKTSFVLSVWVSHSISLSQVDAHTFTDISSYI